MKASISVRLLFKEMCAGRKVAEARDAEMVNGV